MNYFKIINIVLKFKGVFGYLEIRFFTEHTCRRETNEQLIPVVFS